MSKLWVNDGRLILDANGKLMLCDDCPCTTGTGTGTGTSPVGSGDVLLWDWTFTCNWSTVVGVSELVQIYTDQGITVHSYEAGEFSGTAADLYNYSLILWMMPTGNPSFFGWWSEITTGRWPGRMFAICEHSNLSNSASYLNTLTPTHGMTVGFDASPFGNCFDYQAVLASPPHHLSTGTTGFIHVASASLTGGDTVYQSDFDADTGTGTGTIDLKPIIQSKKQTGDTEWVICGDGNSLGDACSGGAALNERFLLNLYNRPIP